MTLKRYLMIMATSTVVCLFLLLYVIWIINPFTTNWVGFLLFYSSLFLSATGLAAIIGFVIRFIFLHQSLMFRLVRDAFRQAFLFGILSVSVLLLLSRSLFTWINMIMLVAVLAFLEYFLITYKKY